MLVQPTEDEGDTLERETEPQPTPSPPHPSVDQHETQTDPSPRPSPTTHIPDSIPEGSGGNHGGQSSSDRSLSGNEGGLTLQGVYDLCISLCTHVTDQAKEIKHLKAHIKKLKKKAKPVIIHHKAWMKSVYMRQRLAGKKSLKKQWMQQEFLDDDTMETEDAQDVGRTSYVVHEEKESAEKGVSTEDPLSTAQSKDSTDKPEDSTDRPDEGTDKPKVSTDKEEVSTNKPDEVLIIMSQNKEKLKEKEKGVELKDVEETERLRSTSTRSLLTLKPLPKIDPKDKGKKMIEEEEREISEAIRNKPPSRNQLRNQMMTYLKHVGGKKHSDLKTKSFEEIKPLYDKIKRFDDSFIAIGSVEDEKVIKEMNEQVAAASKKRVKKDDSFKG
ncbi:hypothetical protein Tco_1206410 [Tanacetum coccineum]